MAARLNGKLKKLGERAIVRCTDYDDDNDDVHAGFVTVTSIATVYSFNTIAWKENEMNFEWAERKCTLKRISMIHRVKCVHCKQIIGRILSFISWSCTDNNTHAHSKYKQNIEIVLQIYLPRKQQQMDIVSNEKGGRVQSA